MVQAQAVKPKTEITELESLQMTRNLLRVAIFNISFLRGLFPEKYFQDSNMKELGMRVKKLVPFDTEARRLIDWIEKGVYDALQKKYVKLLLFGICSGEDGPLVEEYEFHFSYAASSDDVQMSISRPGAKNAPKKVTSSDAKESFCQMVRSLISLMRTLDNVPSERTIVMKLLYYDNTPAEYEPPFFRGCSKDDKMAWLRPPIKMQVGDSSSRHHTVTIRLRSTLDPCEDDNEAENQPESESNKQPPEDGSTIGVVRVGTGSDVTRQECGTRHQESSSFKRPHSPPPVFTSQPTLSRESAAVEKRVPKQQHQLSQEYMNMDRAKASRVQEPIHQSTKKLRSK